MAKADQTGDGIGFALFDTALGRCGVAWTERGVSRVQLPERDDAATEARLSRWNGHIVSCQPTPAAATAIAALKDYFGGAKLDFADIALDLEQISDFHREIYSALRRIGWGQTTTYGALASEVGSPGASRAIGQAMGRNPVPIIVPCHRVLAAGGKPGGFSSFGGRLTKGRLLALEGVALEPVAPLLALMERT